MSESPGPQVQPEPTCSFCGKKKKDVVRLIEHSPTLSICNECTALCVDIVDADNRYHARPPVAHSAERPNPERAPARTRNGKEYPECSFCGRRPHHEVEVLIAGPGVNICGFCVEGFAQQMKTAAAPE